ncbi:MAG: hypothetical protein IKP86_01005 [Anaerolineaceae bacterium]|nr:hypothetical protein [Anaerolineaceae bacterium]
MNQKSSISLGPGASSLILIFVVLAMAVLSMLSLMTARNDLKFSERSADVIIAVYELNDIAEERRAEVDRLLAKCAEDAENDEEYLAAVEAALPEDMELIEDEINWSESDGSRMLDLALRVLPLSEDGLSAWVRHNLMAETGDEWNW